MLLLCAYCDTSVTTYSVMPAGWPKGWRRDKQGWLRCPAEADDPEPEDTPGGD